MRAQTAAELAAELGIRPERVESLKRELRLSLGARDNPNLFCQYVMRDQHGRPWQQQPLHRDWHAMANQLGPGGRLLIGAPREHAKSTQVSVARVAWELGRNPDLRVKIVAANDDLACALLHEIKTNFERNPRLQYVFPRLLPDGEAGWSKSRLYVKRNVIAKDPSVEAAGVLSTGTGGRADLMIFDDVVDLRNAVQQPALRDMVKRAFYEVWMNLLTPEGRAIYVATIWHEDDLTAELAGIGQHRQNPAWHKWWRPAIDEVTGEVLWPSRWSKEALHRKRLEIGPRAFARQYQLQPLSEEESVFPERIIAVCKEAGKQWAPGQIGAPPEWPRYIGVDLASSMGQKAAYTVAFVIAVGPDTKRYPIEIERARLSFDQTVELVARLWAMHRPTQIRVESNAYQEALLQHLRSRYPAMPLVGHTTGRQKADETIGLPGMAATMANGGWVIPSGGEPHSADCPCAWCAWEAELRSYPVGQFSDTVMAMWFADSAAGSAGAHPAEMYFPLA